MYAEYQDDWFDAVRIVQEVTPYDENGQAGQPITWFEWVQLPGRVRSAIGNPVSGNCEIYDRGKQYVFTDGQLARQSEAPHPVLLLGFDVYKQPVADTLTSLQEIGYDLDAMCRTIAHGDAGPSYIIGTTDPDDTETPRFIVDAHQLLCRSLHYRSPRSGAMITVEFNKYKATAKGGWIATELVFRRNGTLLFSENYLEYEALDSVLDSAYDVENFQTDFN